jgi:hypothetical protein
MRTIFLTLLLLAPEVSVAADISVGGVSLTIPNPSGFISVTRQMAVLYDLQKQFVAPTNEEFVVFIPERDVPAALKGDIPDLPRRFTVQTAKTLIGISASTSDFVKLKNIIKSQNDEMMTTVERQLPGLMERMNEGLRKKYEVDLALSVSQMVPMPVHEETDRTLAYSALVKYDMKDQNGDPAPFVAVFTATFVHAKGKVLFLYSHAEESGLAWSKEASRQWANAVVAANPSDLESSVKEALSSAVSGIDVTAREPLNRDSAAPARLSPGSGTAGAADSGIDWGRVGGKAVAGAVAGAIFGLLIVLIGWVTSRGKSRKQSVAADGGRAAPDHRG